MPSGNLTMDIVGLAVSSCHTKIIPSAGKKTVPSHSYVLQRELVAILKTIDYITWKFSKADSSEVHIFSGSQSATGILKLWWQPTQHKQTVAEIRQNIKRMEWKDVKIDMYCTPSHANIKGNEEADRLAKEASGEDKTDQVTMADIKQTTARNGYIPVSETIGIFCNGKINRMLQVDLKFSIKTSLHIVTLLKNSK